VLEELGASQPCNVLEKERKDNYLVWVGIEPWSSTLVVISHIKVI
jgi:hypothetical protein